MLVIKIITVLMSLVACVLQIHTANKTYKEKMEKLYRIVYGDGYVNSE